MDALGIIAALGIELGTRRQGIGEPLAQLPVGKVVRRTVTAVRDHHGLGIFLRGIAPSVVVLHLEGGVAGGTPHRHAHGIVLPHVVIATVSGHILGRHSALGKECMPAGDDVDHSCHGVTAIECRLRPTDNLDVVYVMRIYQAQVVLAPHVAVNTLAVDKDEDIRIAQSAHLHLAAHVAFVEGKRGSQAAQNLLERLRPIAVQHPT